MLARSHDGDEEILTPERRDVLTLRLLVQLCSCKRWLRWKINELNLLKLSLSSWGGDFNKQASYIKCKSRLRSHLKCLWHTNEKGLILFVTHKHASDRQTGLKRATVWDSANVGTNVCLGLTATVPYNELFKVPRLKILISLCCDESHRRG